MKSLRNTVLLQIAIVFLMLFYVNTMQATSYPTTTSTPLDNDLDLNGNWLTGVGDIVTEGPWVDVRAYASLSEAITGAAGKTLLIPNSQTVSSNLTIGSTVNVVVLNGGTFSVANGVTLTINGSFRAPYTHVFNCSGTGTVKFGAGSVSEVYAEWWGAKGDSNMTSGNGTDSTSALQAAINSGITDNISTTQRTVKLLSGKYRITSSLRVPNWVSIVGSGTDTTFIYANHSEINMFEITGKNVCLESFSMRNTYTSGNAGSAVYINSFVANLCLKNLNFREIYNSICITGSGLLIHGHLEGCSFEYNRDDCVKLLYGAQIASVEFNSCRFEATSAKQYSAVGSTHGTVKFINCIFESAYGIGAVDLGDNAINYQFIGCHFENNGSGDGGYNIRLGTGGYNLRICGCIFAYPGVNATNFYDIVLHNNTRAISITENAFCGYPGITTGYSGAIKAAAAQRGMVLSNNTYYYGNSEQSYLSSGVMGAYTLMDRPNRQGSTSEGIFAYVETTNSTPTNIWKYAYVDIDSSGTKALYVIADVVGASSDGTKIAAYTVKTLVYQTGDNNLTTQGNTTETAIESDSNLNCAFSVATYDSGTLYLNVTGLNSTTIHWAASVKLVKLTL